MIAVLELSLIFAFFCFLVMKAIEFLQATQWEATANCYRFRIADTWKLLDINADGVVTHDELVIAAPKLGLTKVQATAMFLRMDVNQSGAIDKNEFYAGFKDELVAVELATPVERMWAYFVQPRRPAGFYSPVDPEKTILADPWVSLFVGFTPYHAHFLALRLVIMVVEAFVLGGMHGWSQGLFLTAFSFVVMAAVLSSPPAVLLAQSRADSIDAIGRFTTYAIYSMVFPKWLSAADAAQAMTVVNALMLVHSIFTQLEPLIKNAPYALAALASLHCARWVETPQSSCLLESEEEEQMVTNLAKLPSTEEAVSLLWNRLRAHYAEEGTLPENLLQALKSTITVKTKSKGKKGPDFDRLEEVTFDATLFDAGLAPLGLKEMTTAVAAVLRQQTSIQGELMSNAELCHIFNEPKYSTDGRLSSVERVTRSLSRSLSIDGESSIGNKVPNDKEGRKRLSKQSSGASRHATGESPRQIRGVTPMRKAWLRERSVSLDRSM